jgi:esterase/lipase
MHIRNADDGMQLAHHGFFSGFKLVRDRLMDLISKIMGRLGRTLCSEIYVTGHSLGGAMATFFAEYLAKKCVQCKHLAACFPAVSAIVAMSDAQGLMSWLVGRVANSVVKIDNVLLRAAMQAQALHSPSVHLWQPQARRPTILRWL